MVYITNTPTHHSLRIESKDMSVNIHRTIKGLIMVTVFDRDESKSSIIYLGEDKIIEEKIQD